MGLFSCSLGEENKKSPTEDLLSILEKTEEELKENIAKNDLENLQGDVVRKEENNLTSFNEEVDAKEDDYFFEDEV